MNEKDLLDLLLKKERHIFSLERKLNQLRTNRDKELRKQGEVISKYRREIKNLENKIDKIENGREKKIQEIEEAHLMEQIDFVQKAFEDSDNYDDVKNYLYRCGVLQ